MNMSLTSHLTLPKEQRRFYFDYVQFQALKKELIEDDITFVEGTDSLYIMGSRTKYINKEACFYWPTVQGELILQTPGEIARTELERHFGKPVNFIKKKKFELLDISPPHFFDGCVRDEAYLYYADLSGAYWQIWRYLTLDCVWRFGLGQKYLYPIGEDLKDYKLARNSIVGITRSHRVHLHKDGDSFSMGFINPWFNPAIWRIIQSILHEVAKTSVLLGACYVATDGYIFENGIQFKSFTDYLDDAGFTYRSQSGEGWLTGWASYKVGSKQTKVKRTTFQGGLDNIEMSEKGGVEWLKKVRKSQKYR